MNIRNITSRLTIAILAVASVSCSDYLDIKPYDKVIPETAEDFSAMIHYRLNRIDTGDDDCLVPSFSTTSSFDAAYGDDFEVCLTGAGGARLPNYIGSFITYNNYNTIYTGLYEIIRDCNIVLHDMTETGTEEADKVRATAHAMRGVAYYQLLRMFCQVPEPGAYESQLGVPLVTEFDMEAVTPRATMAQTITQIESDLKTSIAYNMTDPIFRFTADVSKGYLARFYFWTRRWSDCLDMTSELLTAHPLLDIDGYKAMVNGGNKLHGNQLIKAYTSTSASASSATSGTISTLSYRPVSIRFLSHFTDEERTTDVRYPMWVNTMRQATKPIFCGMRAAEFKLMEAEALYHLSRPTDALNSINDLREKRIEGYQRLSMQDLPSTLNPREIVKVDVNGNALTPLMALILSERRKELFLEGDRFFELKRNGSPEFSTFYNGVKYTTLSYMYTFPIPIRDLDITSVLVQNPGYVEIVNKN